MRCSPWFHRASLRAVSFSLALVSLGALGCPKQENFPTQYDVIVPPKPSNFQITRQGTAYTFSWDISDPTDVDRYLVYALGGGIFPDELIAETTETTVPYDIGESLTGLQFAVFAVSTDNVEGERAFRTAP